mgnify:CR=1 FL=1
MTPMNAFAPVQFPSPMESGSIPSMPHNLEAEQALLGSLMFDNAVFERLSDRLRGAHFYEPFHQRLYEAIEDHIRQGMLAEPTILMERFKLDPAFQEFGGLRYLADLVDRAPPAANAPDYARVVYDLALRRDLIRIGGEIVREAPQPETAAIDQIEQAEQQLYTLAETGKPSSGFVSFSSALSGAVQMAAEAYQRDGKLAGLATHLDDLDSKLGGLHPSDLLVLAGRPSMGKTALATNIAFNIARNYRWEPTPEGRKTVSGGVVAFYSLEMSAEQLAMRILADASGVSSDKLRKGEIDAADFGRIREAAVEIGESPLFIDATGGLSISKLAARARREMVRTNPFPALFSARTREIDWFINIPVFYINLDLRYVGPAVARRFNQGEGGFIGSCRPQHFCCQASSREQANDRHRSDHNLAYSRQTDVNGQRAANASYIRSRYVRSQEIGQLTIQSSSRGGATSQLHGNSATDCFPVARSRKMCNGSTLPVGFGISSHCLTDICMGLTNQAEIRRLNSDFLDRIMGHPYLGPFLNNKSCQLKPLSRSADYFTGKSHRPSYKSARQWNASDSKVKQQRAIVPGQITESATHDLRILHSMVKSTGIRTPPNILIEKQEAFIHQIPQCRQQILRASRCQVVQFIRKR